MIKIKRHLPFIIRFLLCICCLFPLRLVGQMPKERFNKNYTTDILLFEQQWVLKKVGDNLFIKGGEANTEKAYGYYEKARKIGDQYNTDKIVNTRHYFLEPSRNQALIDYVNIDIEYRMGLIENGIDFWGVDFHEKVLLPNVHLKAFQSNYELFYKLYERIDKLLASEIDTDTDLIENEISQITQAFESEKITIDLNSYQFKKRNLTSRRDDLNKRIKSIRETNTGLAKEANKILKEIDDLEGQISANIQNAILSYMSSNIAEIQELNSSEEQFGLNSINDLTFDKDVGGGILNSMLSTTSGLPEWMELAHKVKDGYEQVVNWVKLADQIKNSLENGELNVESVISIGSKISQRLSAHESTKDLGKSLEQKVRWLEKADQVVKSAEISLKKFDKSLRLKDCLGSRGNTIQCIEGKLRQLKKDYRKFKSNELDWLLEQLEGYFPDSNLNLEEYVSQLEPIDYIETSEFAKEYLPSLEQVKQLEKLIKDVKAVDKKDFNSLFVIGDTIFESGIFTQEHKENWKKYVEEIKPVRLVFSYLLEDNTSNFQDLVVELLKLSEYSQINDLVDMVFQSIISQYKYFGETNKSFIDSLILKEYSKEIVINFKGKPRFLRGELSDDHLFPLYKTRQFRIEETYIYAPNKPNGTRLVEYPLTESHSVWLNNLSKSSKISISKKREFILSYLTYFPSNLNMIGKEFLTEYVQNNNQLNEELNDILFDSMFESLSNDKKNLFKLNAAKTLVGGVTFTNKSNFSKVGSKSFSSVMMKGGYPRAFDDNSESDLKKQIIVNSLNAYLPGLGSSIVAFDNFSAVDKKMKLYNKLYDQIKHNKDQENELNSKLDEFELQLGMLDFEEERAKISSQLLNAKYSLYGDIRANILIAKKRNREKIANSLPAYFFLSEKLRKEFELLNKALKFWRGKTVEETYTSDLNYIYLAIDPEIRLFDWFQLNHIGKRTNVGKIFYELERINTSLNSYHKINLTNLNVATTTIRRNFDSLRVENKIKIDLENYRPYEFNKRIVRLGAYGLDKSGNKISLEGFNIIHKGESQIRKSNNDFTIEQLEERNMQLSNFQNPDFITETPISERDSWLEYINSEKMRPGKNFFGYGMESLFVIEGIDSLVDKNLNELVVQIRYIFDNEVKNFPLSKKIYKLDQDYFTETLNLKDSITINSKLIIYNTTQDLVKNNYGIDRKLKSLFLNPSGNIFPGYTPVISESQLFKAEQN